jgi:hypothetical protein
LPNDPELKRTVRSSFPSPNTPSPLIFRPFSAGPTYCAIASFSLSARLSSLPSLNLLFRWLLDRQVRPPPRQPASESGSEDEDEGEAEGEEDPLAGLEERAAGFQGRANKPTDACYSFWSNAALQVRLLPFLAPSRPLSLLILLYDSSSSPPSTLPPSASPTSSTPSSTGHGCSAVSTLCTAESHENREQHRVRLPLFFLHLSLSSFLSFEYSSLTLGLSRRLPLLPLARRPLTW